VLKGANVGAHCWALVKIIELLIARIVVIICANVSSLANCYCFLLYRLSKSPRCSVEDFPLLFPLFYWPKRKKRMLG
jgi:hypothetical protein